MLVTTTVIAPEPPKIESLQDVFDLLRDSMTGLVAGFVENLPLYLIALVVLVIGMVGVKFAMRGVEQGLGKGSLDSSLQKLTATLVRTLLFIVLAMVTLSVAGIDVGAALAAFGLLGLAFAFAFQNILENFIAGLLILLRKPFKIGDQIVAGDFEGTVLDINMRITKLRSYEGIAELLPNADLFRNPLVNLTELGTRRSSVFIGVDYRDDHNAVADVIRDAVAGVEGVLDGQPVEVLCAELGASSVDFEIRYWTLPDAMTVRHTQDRVLRIAKDSVEAAGMSIPWPIRTLEPGADLSAMFSRER